MEPKQDLLKNPHLAFEILVFLEPNFRKNLFDKWVHGDSSVDQEVGVANLKTSSIPLKMLHICKNSVKVTFSLKIYTVHQFDENF